MAGGRTTHQQKLISSICQTDQELDTEREGWDFFIGSVVKTLPYNAGGAGSISGLGTEIPHASEPPKSEHKQQKQYFNKLNKDIKKKKKEPRGKLPIALRKTVTSKGVSQVPHQCFSLSVKPSGVSFIPLLPSHLLNNKKSTVKALIGFIE